MRSIVLDGDVLRTGINSDLGFSRQDRSENLRRVTEIVKLFAGAGIIPIISVISPYIEDRNNARYKLHNYRFIEVYVKCSLATCESRDPKGLYKKARQRSIDNFTGISDIYEPPVAADLVIDTEVCSYAMSLNALWEYVHKCIYAQALV
jgi:adenylylsulfate kinase